MEAPNNFRNPEELYTFLNMQGVDTSSWGVEDGTKSVAELFDEISNGESTLFFKRDYLFYEASTEDESAGELPAIRLHRNVSASEINVFTVNPQGDRLMLYEMQQVWHDGRQRQRNLTTSLSEKSRAAEPPIEAAIRGLKEEIGIDVDADQLEPNGAKVLTSQSGSYPGLISIVKVRSFNLELDGEVYLQNPEGFIEEDHNKKTYFGWKLVE